MASAQASKHLSQYFIYSFSAIINKTKPKQQPLKATYVRILRILFIIPNQSNVVCSAKLCQTYMKVNLENTESLTSLWLLYIQYNPCHD